MIVPYYGEFLQYPVPLELSYGACSHNCAYCFARLNQRKRKVELKKIMRLLANYQNRTTLVAELLKGGYPVVLSNRSDPFAKSNYKYTLPLLEVMTNLNIPLSFETKTGHGIDDALKFLKPAVWYITVEMLDESIAKRIDPGAPLPEQRIATVKKIVGYGHKVVVAINPCVPEWLPEPERLIEKLVNAGVSGVWVDQLHLSHQQMQNATLNEIEAIGDDLIDRAKGRGSSKKREVDRAWVEHVILLAIEAGLSVFRPGYDKQTDFFNVWHDVYEKCFPTNQDLVNICFRDGITPDNPFVVSDYVDFMMEKLPKGSYTGMRDYVFTGSFALRKLYKLPSGKLNYQQILAFGYDAGKIKWSPAAMRLFTWCGYTDVDGGKGVYLDENYKLPFMAFVPWGHDEAYFDDLNDGVITMLSNNIK